MLNFLISNLSSSEKKSDYKPASSFDVSVEVLSCGVSQKALKS